MIMRRLIAVIMTTVFAFMAFTGCSKTEETSSVAVQVESPVTMEQVNTDGRYVARAFMESIYADDEELFVKCYPDGYVDRINETSDADYFEQFQETTKISAEFIGTAFVDSRDVTAENGYDVDVVRASICWPTALDSESIEAIQLQKIRVFFKNDAESAESDIFYIVYKVDGNWYLFSTYTGEATF